jgi:hypothetical protein
MATLFGYCDAYHVVMQIIIVGRLIAIVTPKFIAASGGTMVLFAG